MGVYITHDTVRRTIGLDTTQISDTDIDSFITEIESLVPKFFNTVFTMTEKIDVLDGDGSDRVVLDSNPVWAVRELISDTVTEVPANLYVYGEGGRVNLSTSSIISRFPNKRNIIRVRYLYGKLDKTTTQTKTTISSIVGSPITLSVASSTGFVATDWVYIKGMDGNYEATQISSVGTGTITVDQLVYTHLSGSIITKLAVSPNFTRIMNVLASIAVLGKMIGSSASAESAYSLGELNVTLQAPNVLWKETYNMFISERDELYKRIKIRPAVV